MSGVFNGTGLMKPNSITCQKKKRQSLGDTESEVGMSFSLVLELLGGVRLPNNVIMDG
jgi:hypothetical protein